MVLVPGDSGKNSLAANVLFIILAAALRLDSAVVMWAYFMESVVIGFFHFLRIAHATIRSEKRYVADTLFTAGLFALHFSAVHLAIFAALVILAPFPVALDRVPLAFLGAFVFFLAHGISFLGDTKGGMPGHAEAMRDSLAAYERAVPVYAALAAAGILRAFMQIDMAALLALMALKAALDLRSENGRFIKKKAQIKNR